MKFYNKKLFLYVLILFGFGVSTLCSILTLVADDVTDAIEDGLKKYDAGKYGEAAGQFDYAAQLTRQKKANQIKDFLNSMKPLDGWIGEEATSTAAGAGMMGGGITVERKFKKDSSLMDVSLMSDSPLMQSMMMMFSNPMMAASSGGELATIGGQKAIVKYDPNNNKGEINIVVDGRYLYNLKGRKISKEDMVRQVETTDFGALSSIP